MHTDYPSRRLATGAPLLDEPHRDILQAIGRAASAGEPEFAACFCAVVEALEADFRHEEDLMEKIGFPGQAMHLEQHARTLAGLHHADSALLAGDQEPARRAMALLPKWLELHVETHDAVLAIALDMAQGPHAPPATPADR